MRRAVAALGAALALASTARAQAPRGVSPALARAAALGDTLVTAWVIARPGADLQQLAADVTRLGGTIRVTSRFVHAVSATLPGRALRSAARLPGVRRVQPVATLRRRPAPTPDPGPAFAAAATVPAPGDTLYGANAWVAAQLNVNALHALGLRGAGVRIALIDAGFNTLHPFMAGATILAQRDFVNDDSIVRDEPGDPFGEMAHGTATWSLIAANAPGRLVGVAPDASFILAKTEYTPTETRVEEDRWVAAVEWADSIGVDIISSSVSYLSFDNGFSWNIALRNGDLATTTIAADEAARRGILVVVAVGNSGPAASSIETPADGDSLIAVGAVDSAGTVASFSSRGPTGDGRIKPDLVAAGFEVTFAGIDSGTARGNGTSFSAPLVAGMAALVQGTRLGRPAFDLRQGLIDAADGHLAPSNTRGYGIPDARALLVFPSGIQPAVPLPGPTPTFAWDAGTPPPGIGPTLYRVRVGTDSTLGQAQLDTTVADTSVTLPFAAQPGVRLYWQVAASNASVGAVESTTVQGPVVIPPWVTLLTLAAPAGHSIRDSLPRFAWRAARVTTPPGPFAYDVDVYPASRSVREAVASARGLADTVFQPASPLEKNLPYRWRVVARLAGGDSSIVTSSGTFVVLDETAPPATVLFQNFPNPFPSTALGVSATCFWFDVGVEGPVTLGIYDLRGRLMRRLVPSVRNGVPATLPAGRYGRPPAGATGTCDPRFMWDGRDETGAYVRPGVYLYRLTAPGFNSTRHVVFQGAP